MGMKLEAAWLRDFAKRYTGAWCSQAGRSAITEVAQGFMSAFPDMQLLMDGAVIQGGSAVYHWTFIGTNTGPGGTGHRVRFSGYEVWKFGEDGLIAESQAYFDAADYQSQLERGVD
jgi:predicted ester cyclase